MRSIDALVGQLDEALAELVRERARSAALLRERDILMDHVRAQIMETTRMVDHLNETTPFLQHRYQEDAL